MTNPVLLDTLVNLNLCQDVFTLLLSSPLERGWGEDLMFYNLTRHHLTTLRSYLNDIRTLAKLLQIDIDIAIDIDITTQQPLPEQVIHLIALQLLGSFDMHQTTGWVRV